MKKTVFVFMVLLCFGVVTTFIYADNKQQEIKLTKKTQDGQMRVPGILEEFHRIILDTMKHSIMIRMGI